MSFGDCPYCSNRQVIEVLRCWRCDTTVTGRFAIPALARLPEAQARFVERFLLANGSLSKVQEEMGCSYPKARRLLDESMSALQAEIRGEMREKQAILDALEAQRLDGREAVRL